ncbi:MAG: 3-dehydroquinate synthase [Cellvibrionaceae bacterium]
MKTLKVDLDDRSYPIYIGEGLLNNPGLLTSHIRASEVLIVTNTVVAPLYLEKIKVGLDGYRVAEVILPDGEQYKSLETLNLIFDKLLGEKHSRAATLVALGGGVIGDMTGFAAACYQRGVDFIQIPTTVLSQVDSSVGGKTAVNHPLGKNMIGAFYQPKSVVIDIDVLDTLPGRELSAGLAEVIKYGLIYDGAFLVWLEENIERLMVKDPQAMIYAIERSCAIKAEVVAQDEKESGIRALLNLGHTFGHAIETACGYGSWLHGEAVAAGTVMAARLSKMRGWIDGADEQRITQLFERASLPVKPPKEMTVEQFIELMGRDKKVIDGKLRLVLLKKLGEAIVDGETTTEMLSACIQDCIDMNSAE